MSNDFQLERNYQNEIIKLFTDKLGYSLFGSLQYQKDEKCLPGGRRNSPFREEDFIEFLKSRNAPDGSPLYTDYQIKEVISNLKRDIMLPSAGRGALMTRNSTVYERMIYGVGAPREPGKNNETIMLFDFNNPLANHFALAEEVSFIDPLTGTHCRPDLVVYVNGFALAVIELKRCLVSVDEAIKQQLSNQSNLIPSFFTTTQFSVVASDKNGFQYATILTPKRFWCPYKKDTTEVGHSLNDKESFTEFFDKSRFISFFRYGILNDGGIKKVMRPHQFHALMASIPRLRDKKSGVIWHSQGSGKSLTMIWLAKYIKMNFDDPRLLIITDRIELDHQIFVNFQKTGEKSYHARSGSDLLDVLAGNYHNLDQNRDNIAPWLICSLIHKFGHNVSECGDEIIEKSLEDYIKEIKSRIKQQYPNGFNPKGENIFVFVDECHRTQSGKLHEAMKEIMGDGVMFIGFTGTPLLRNQKNIKDEKYNEVKDASEIKFGPYIHKYLHKQAVEDKVILDLQYEARDVEQQITDKEKLDAKKNEITKNLSDEQKKKVDDRWATLEKIYSSQERIERIGYSILDDMQKYPLDETWCNAMLVAGSIHQAFRYYDFFQNKSSDTTLRGRVAVVTSYDPIANPPRKNSSDPYKQTEEQECHDVAMGMFETFGQKDSESFENFAKEQFIKHPGSMKLIIVVDKLLTGFDAPCATYLYIDKEMRDHNLFQAICRVNRLGADVEGEQGEIIKTRKEWGRIVDFKHLFNKIEDSVRKFNGSDDAFGAFEEEDIEELLSDFVQTGERKLRLREGIYDSNRASWQEKNIEEILNGYLQDKDGITALERRQLFYRQMGGFVASYASMSDYLSKTSYTKEEIQLLYNKVKDAANLVLRLKQISGDDFDAREKDPEMRALLDRFIDAKEAELILSATEDFSFLDTIDNVNKAASTAAKKGKGAAAGIKGKIRAVINSWGGCDKKTYQVFSERLQALLDELHKTKLDDLEEIKKLIEFYREAKAGGCNFPDGIKSKLAKALWNNLESWAGNPDEETYVEMILTVERIIRDDAPENWKDTSSSSAQVVADAFADTFPNLTDEQLALLFELARQNT